MKYCIVNLVLIVSLCLISFLNGCNENKEVTDAISEKHQNSHNGAVPSKQRTVLKMKKKPGSKLSRTVKNPNEDVPFHNAKNNITSGGDQLQDDYNEASELEDNNSESYDEENDDYYLEEGDEELDGEPITEDQKQSQSNIYKKKALVTPLTNQITSDYKRKSRKSSLNKKRCSVEKVHWEPWSGWSPCSVSCGLGKQTRWRNSVHGSDSTYDKPDEEMEHKRCQMPACSPLDLLRIFIA